MNFRWLTLLYNLINHLLIHFSRFLLWLSSFGHRFLVLACNIVVDYLHVQLAHLLYLNRNLLLLTFSLLSRLLLLLIIITIHQVLIPTFSWTNWVIWVIIWVLKSIVVVYMFLTILLLMLLFGWISRVVILLFSKLLWLW